MLPPCSARRKNSPLQVQVQEQVQEQVQVQVQVPTLPISRHEGTDG